MSPSRFRNLTVLDHPLIRHKLTILRDRRTSTRDFKQLVNEIAVLMAYEVTKDLPLEPVEIETPLERMTGVQLAGKKLTLVPILRAGLGMVEGIAELIPSARVGHIGLYRDHDTLMPVEEVLARIDAVTPDDIRAVAGEILGQPKHLAVVGPFEQDRDFTAAVA